MQKTRPAEKLEWIVSELGEGAGLLDFARKYRELFGEKTQKANCLDLYRQYANIAKTEERGPYPTLADARKLSYSMECQVPPEELEAFERGALRANQCGGEAQPRLSREEVVDLVRVCVPLRQPDPLLEP